MQCGMTMELRSPNSLWSTLKHTEYLVTGPFVAGQFGACITDRNIIKKDGEREKLIKREVSCRDEDNFIEKKKRKRKIQRNREKRFYLHRHIRSHTFQVLT